MSTPQYLDIPLDQLHDSPTQPRLAYDQAYLQELGADIKSHGRNLSPLLVRPRVPALFAAVGDAELARDATAGYEIVFGHCRKRGCEIAGLSTARCEVRAMTDQEVERAQISENLQRKNVHPFEEAAGFQALIERHKDTADAIAERTGKSRSYIYGRLKLLQACAEVRQACVAGEIGAEVALLVARLRSDKLQAKALARIRAKAWDLKDGGARSYRNIRELLNEEFTLDLKAALFPIEADNLAGAGPCPTCPKRSANAPEYQDVAEDRKRSPWTRQNLGPNVCTDPDCFAAKKAAHFKAEADALRKAGRAVIDGNKARALVGADGKVKGGYLPLAQVKDEMKRATAKLGGVFAPTAVLIQDPRTGKMFQAVKESELVEAGVLKAAAAKATAPRSSGGYNSEEEQRKRQEREDLATTKNARNKRWLQAMREAIRARDRSDFDLRLICNAMLERADDYEYSGLNMLMELRDCKLHQLRGQVDLMPSSELAALLLEIVLAEGCEVDSWDVDTEPGALRLAAAHYGVALTDDAPPPSEAARAQDEGEAAPATPSPAALAPASAPAKGKGKAKNQAGAAGKDDKGAGSAGVSSSTTPADAGGVAASRGLLDEVPA